MCGLLICVAFHTCRVLSDVPGPDVAGQYLSLLTPVTPEGAAACFPILSDLLLRVEQSELQKALSILGLYQNSTRV